MKFLSLTYLFLVFSLYVQSQSLSNFRQQTVVVSQDTISLDSLSLVPKSLIVRSTEGQILGNEKFYLNESKSLIAFDSTFQGQKLRLSYRVLPVNWELSSYGSLFQLEQKTDSNQTKNLFQLDSRYRDRNSDYQSETLNKSGYISRGMNFGNNQDVVVNSALNMQLSGQLTDGIKIKASISDNNIPIQPDGNTQQIQEFDKIFITLYNDKTSLTLGDYEINKPKGYFLNSNKKVMGAKIDHRFNFKKQKESELNVSVSGAVAKGKFNRQEIQGQESVQGPYQLQGANNETYIIILAGTEKVYIDGELLKRGENHDYTIDYNIAEVTFTTRKLITKDSRIVIEFEYSDKNYAKFTVANSNHFKTKNSEFWLNVLSDHESKNQPINADYSDEEKLSLLNAGDDPFKAITYSFDSLGFSANEVRYQKIDSLGYDSVFVYSTDPTNAIYRVVFAFVGQGHGDYQQIRSSANGRVFEWLEPKAGVPQGSYLPIKLLVTPKSQQMLTTGGKINLKSFTQFSYELALSNFDANTYSTIDSEDDMGWAYKMDITQDLLLKDTSNHQLQIGFMLENVDENFYGFERFRSIEFNRNWNVKSLEGIKNQSYGAKLYWEKKDWANMDYKLRLLNIADDFKGIKNDLSGNLFHKKWTGNLNTSWLQTDFTEGKSDFVRTNSMLSYQLTEQLSIGASEETEINRWFNNNDSLVSDSYSFVEWSAFTSWQNKKNNSSSLTYTNREDRGLSDNSLGMANRSQTITFATEVNSVKNQKLKANIAWREVVLVDSAISRISKNEQSFIGKLEHYLKLYKNAISFRTLYELSSGLELKKEFAYIEVAAGQGIYQWIDYNSNGVQELNEFERATYQDQAKYIKVNIPSNEYIKAYSNQFTETINLYPYKVWRNKTGVRKFISRFNNLLTYKVKKKVKDDDIGQILNSFNHSVVDSSLLSLSQSFRNTLSFNRINPKYGIDYIFMNHENKILLTNGFDSRTTLTHGLNLRININKSLSLNNRSDYNEKNYLSDFFPGNNYELIQISDKLELSYQVSNQFRIIGHYQYKIKNNESGIQRAELNELGIEFKYNVANKSNIQVNIDYFMFDYNDQANTSIAFEMLEGLLPGNNGKWSALFQTQLSKYLQLNLSYLGRVAEEGNVIHNGQAQLRAFF